MSRVGVPMPEPDTADTAAAAADEPRSEHGQVPVVAEVIDVAGIVQGVGFRPFVAGLATELGLRGHVGNDATRVFIEVAGPASAIDELVRRLSDEPPPLARIDRLTRTAVEPSSQAERTGFEIVASRTSDGQRTLVPPDTAVCADCVRELLDPTDRRYRHPFITCTNCGPRFTIITGLPYDRVATTMASFPLCPACRQEYEDPTDRRYHAQPIGCHDCGPTLSYRSATGDRTGDGALAAAATALYQGEIVAVKGLGGYHLACRADDDEAVARLRARKHRADKPFAVMVANLAEAERLAEISGPEAGLLTSGAAPIVLLRARPDGQRSELAELVAPGNPLVGIMVAYTPLHHLLLAEVGRPLVMTSANRGGEPLAIDAETLGLLSDLYDGVLDHDRPIHQACDDSVVRVVAGRLLPIRRARGYAPIPVPFPSGGRPVLATGAELKNTFCVATDGRAWVSQHVGDMGNLPTLNAFSTSVEHYRDLYRIEPEVVAADAHPAYLSSRWARDRHGDRVVEVQHHHAHVAAIMAEHQLDPNEPLLGFAFDGTGFGPDGTIWGGEVLDVTVDGFRRVAHLSPIPLPGGDAAIEFPDRVALAHLWAAGIDWSDDLPPVAGFDPAERQLLTRMLEGRVNAVETTSMGRLFDAVASLLDLRHHVNYEAQAAIDLEIAAADGRDDADPGYRFTLDPDPHLDPDHDLELGDERGPSSIGCAPVLQALIDDQRDEVPVPTRAWRFHQAVVDVVVRLAVADRARTGRTAVALTGGVFQNALLAERSIAALADNGIVGLTHALVPPNDGGLALGQAFIAAHRTAAEPAAANRTREPEEN